MKRKRQSIGGELRFFFSWSIALKANPNLKGRTLSTQPVKPNQAQQERTHQNLAVELRQRQYQVRVKLTHAKVKTAEAHIIKAKMQACSIRQNVNHASRIKKPRNQRSLGHKEPQPASTHALQLHHREVTGATTIAVLLS